MAKMTSLGPPDMLVWNSIVDLISDWSDEKRARAGTGEHHTSNFVATIEDVQRGSKPTFLVAVRWPCAIGKWRVRHMETGWATLNSSSPIGEN